MIVFNFKLLSDICIVAFPHEGFLLRAGKGLPGGLYGLEFPVEAALDLYSVV